MSKKKISQLVHRYADAVVHKDSNQWISTWAKNSIWDLGNDRIIKGRKQIQEYWEASMENFVKVIQTVANGDATLGSERGIGRWYFQEIFEKIDGKKGILVAHYQDQYISVKDEWLFAERKLCIHYKEPSGLTGDFNDEAN
tara:strand:+ start:27 stop:449 length:423 start_codon:yes stop_codon:yes gene_type:complete